MSPPHRPKFDRLSSFNFFPFRVATVERGEPIELDIEKFADEGASLVRVNGDVVPVEDAVPGAHVQAHVYDTRSNYAEAKLGTLLEPSDLHVESRCRYADACGGLRAAAPRVRGALEAK